jgi:hypothetical protein
VNTLRPITRRLLLVVLSTTGLAVSSLVHAAQPQFVGPRNSVRLPAPVKASHERSFEQLQASTEDSSTCTVLRSKHYGHPGKGYRRFQKIDGPCGRSRMSGSETSTSLQSNQRKVCSIDN